MESKFQPKEKLFISEAFKLARENTREMLNDRTSRYGKDIRGHMHGVLAGTGVGNDLRVVAPVMQISEVNKLRTELFAPNFMAMVNDMSSKGEETLARLVNGRSSASKHLKELFLSERTANGMDVTYVLHYIRHELDRRNELNRRDAFKSMAR